MPRCFPPRVSPVFAVVGVIFREVMSRSVVKWSRCQIRREIRRKITRRHLPEAPASAPAAPVRSMRPAALVATSSGSSCVWPESPGLQELVDDVVVLGELLRYDVAFRGVVASICAVVCAVGVSSCYSSHRRSATYVPLVRSIPLACGVGCSVWRPVVV